MKSVSGLMGMLISKIAEFGLKTNELPLKPEKTTVWCGLWAGGIIDPYFFKKEAGRNVIIDGARYCAMITNYLLREIERRNPDDTWFQQDGVTCHTTRDTMVDNILVSS